MLSTTTGHTKYQPVFNPSLHAAMSCPYNKDILCGAIASSHQRNYAKIFSRHLIWAIWAWLETTSDGLEWIKRLKALPKAMLDAQCHNRIRSRYHDILGSGLIDLGNGFTLTMQVRSLDPCS